MPDGAAIVKYAGKRGTVFRVKYRDANGVQVMETLGRVEDGWTRRKAEAELRARLTAVHRDGHVKLKRMTFAGFAAGWLQTHADSKALKRSTVQAYQVIIDRHLLPAFGMLAL